MDQIRVKGAREHNLQSVSVDLPRNQMTVITGLSGSGKSSLAFDTIYAEGQRRYIESLSAYARNFLEQLKKPDVDSISGLSPSIAIDQKTISSNPRSTVGTVTEVYDFLRLLYAKVGTPECPTHHIPVERQSPATILEDVMSLTEGSKIFILAPIVRGKKGEYSAEFRKWLKKGFTKALIDGAWVELSEAKKLARHKRHDISLVVDRVVVKPSAQTRLSEAINKGVSLSDGFVTVFEIGQEPKQYSIHAACTKCGFSFPEIEPRLFSFNNPKGSCPDCKGLGTKDFSEEDIEKEEGVGVDRRRVRTAVLKYKGESVESRGEDSDELDEYGIKDCPTCKGARLRQEALSVFIGEKRISDLSNLPIKDLKTFIGQLSWPAREKQIAEKISQQILSRLDYLERVGTGYLSLSRHTRTLSGGEAQRIRLAAQVGSALIGILYILDEPSIGLHPRDHQRLLGILKEIRDRGNTVILVEHDEDTMRGADYLLDMGPRAGRLGGEVIGRGSLKEILKNKESLTGAYLSGKKRIPYPAKRRPGNGLTLEIEGARGNNLKSVDLVIPLGTLTGVTGVSGSGKSTLIVDTLYRALARQLNRSSLTAAPFSKLRGTQNIDKIIEINQKPIGRTPRSVPATYVQLFPQIRELFSKLPDSKLRGYGPGHFSFNVKGGRCENCQGGGQVKVQMHFLSDVYVRCTICQGRRYSREILNVKYREKSIADVLAMTVSEALEFFENHRLIRKKLETLEQVGLNYISLGQSSTTLSGGEAQRIKLSRELSKRGTGQTLYILDEPTTGLHFEDVGQLMTLLHSLVDQGNTVILIEHHLDVIKNCDHLIELGPEGGSEGGVIVAQGSPEKISQHKTSHTASFLKPLLN